MCGLQKIVFKSFSLRRRRRRQRLSEKLKTFSNLKIYLKGTVENLDEIYADKDLIIFPSFKESFGRVLIESWSYGKPVICSDLAAFKEIHEIAKINLSLTKQTSLF